MNEISIVLENSTHAQNFGYVKSKNSTIVHVKEFEKVFEILDHIIPYEAYESHNNNLHNTITVLGSRGSGKTSFLLSIKHEIERERNKIGDNVQVLNIIDPTLIEEKGHVFLNVISRISDLINKTSINTNTSAYGIELNQMQRKRWEMSLYSLAAGLPSIDGIGEPHNESWQDPEFVMDSGLRAVDASLKLADNFNEFLKLSLEILRKKAFILMFDDIDIDSRKGWAVLETIRKYFIGARLITIVSGDLKLYSTVVRQKKWQNFGHEIIEYEGKLIGNIATYNSMVTELESQYLQKVLQPKFRIHLPTIGDLILGENNIKVYKKSTDLTNGYGVEISKLYISILKQIGIQNSISIRPYLNFLLNLPLRTQVQILSTFNGDHIFIDGEKVASLIDVFISDLYIKELTPNDLLKNSNNLNNLVISFLLKEKKIEELYQLQPITNDSSMNSALFVMNFILSYRIRSNSYIIFDYLIKVGYIRNLVPIIGYRKQNKENLEASIEDLCQNIITLNDIGLKDVVGRITSYMRGHIDKGANSESISKVGTIPLFGMADKAKKMKQASSGRIDAVLNSFEASNLDRLLVYLPLSSNQYVYKQASLLTYSPYLLLSIIGELGKKTSFADIRNAFSELAQLRGYVMPDFKRGNSEDYEIQDDYDQDIEDEDMNFEFHKFFMNWLDKYPKDSVSIQLIGKISTRFFYALTNLENKIGNKRLGTVFQAQIITFMNAVLIEDCKENSSISYLLNLNNTNYSDFVFVSNLNKITKASDDNSTINLSFSKWMLSCPLLLVYLKKDTILQEVISKYCETSMVNNILEFSVASILEEIPIRNIEDENIDLLPISLSRKNYAEIIKRLNTLNFQFDNLTLDNVDYLKSSLRKIQVNKVTDITLRNFINNLKQS